ncbi:MAG: DUF58 domain-containing protein [Flavobacteriales bacterium]|nr:DUF58 domain-containing protein [Flavobacteriales bacterium]|tara:strand:+ start:2321 stop:3661 length:1341 start_codon:yes stop_codon:yes gene_type:complete
MKKNKFISNIYLTNWFYLLLGISASFFIISFLFEHLFFYAQFFLALVISYFFIDLLILFFGSENIEAERIVKDQFNLGDKNQIKVRLKNRNNIPVKIKLIDELPFQFQIRDFSEFLTLERGEEKIISYQLIPVKRGSYLFGALNVFVRSFLSTVQRRIQFSQDVTVKVYPSVRLMREYELKVFTKLNLNQGVKKVRQIGNAQEFEQIKPYVQGDDFRKINWKATGRKGGLMVNQFQDERSQTIYSIVDKSRAMKMPFNNMTLLDHSINSALVISNIALRKDDKVGLMTFSDKLGVHVKADKLGGQLRKLLENLYRQKTRYNEANFEMLYFGIRQNIKGRSLLFLYSNFESTYAMERAMPVLRKISKLHLLVVVFFENKGLVEKSNIKASNIEEIYLQTIAQKSVIEKQTIAAELNKFGINTILTTPEKLNVDTINKYLELKSRGLI